MKNKRFTVLWIILILGFIMNTKIFDISAVAASGTGGGYASDSKQILEDLNIDAVLTPSGDMQVTETWKANLKNRNRAYHNLYLTFETDKTRGQTIENLSVYDVDAGISYLYEDGVDPVSDPNHASNTCYINRANDDMEIGWFLPEIDEGIRTFRISYTIRNILEVHKDTAVLYRQFVGKNFTMPVTKLTGSITLPQGASKPELHAWLHCTAESLLTIDSGEKLTFTAENVPAKSMVEVRLCAPPRLFPSALLLDDSSVLADISKQEQQWADDWASKQRMNYMLGILDAAGGLLLAITGIFILLFVKHKLKRHTVEVPEYTREIPAGNSPGGIANLFYFYNDGVSDDKRSRVFSATILSLARKGYVQFQQNDSDNLLITPTESVKNMPLTSSEKYFHNMLRTVASSNDGSFTMKQFEAYGKAHYQYLDNTVNQFLSITKQEIADRGYYEKNPIWISFLSLGGALFIIFAFILFIMLQGEMVFLPFGLAICGVMLLFAGATKPKLSPLGEHDYGVWHGLKKYMLEFSRMEEYGVPQLALWEEYLVYATMMNISKQVSKQIKMICPPSLEADSLRSNPYLYYTLYGNHIHMGTGSGDFGTSLGNSINNASRAATRLAHPPTSSSSSGGGFGGGGFGGGGGGMGGGGGAR